MDCFQLPPSKGPGTPESLRCLPNTESAVREVVTCRPATTARLYLLIAAYTTAPELTFEDKSNAVHGNFNSGGLIAAVGPDVIVSLG